MITNMYKKSLIIALMMIVLSACRPVLVSPSPTWTIEHVELPAITATDLPTVTASVTSAPTSTRTPLPTATAVSTLSPTPLSTPTPPARLETIPGHVILYVADGGLKSIPARSVFEHPEMRTVYNMPGELPLPAPCPSPDGRWLLVNGFAAEGGEQSGATWLVDLATGELVMLHTPAVWPSWSPDSRRIAYVLNDTLYTLGVTGDHQPTAIWEQKGLFRFFARWSPTGEWIAVANVANPEAKADWTYTYWLVSPDGKETRNLGTFVVGGTEAGPESLDWSPDGALLDTPSRMILTVDGQHIEYTELEDDPPFYVPSRFTSWLLGHDRLSRITMSFLSTQSHNGDKIAYPGLDGLYVFDRLAQTDTRISGYDLFEANQMQAMLWSQDDRWLVIGVWGGAIYALEPESGQSPLLLVKGQGMRLVGIVQDVHAE